MVLNYTTHKNFVRSQIYNKNLCSHVFPIVLLSTKQIHMPAGTKLKEKSVKHTMFKFTYKANSDFFGTKGQMNETNRDKTGIEQEPILP